MITERIYTSQNLDVVGDIRIELARQGGGDDRIPLAIFALAEPVQARTEDTRDWIMIGGLLEAAGLALLAYLSNVSLIYALAAVAFLVVAVGYVLWCGVWE